VQRDSDRVVWNAGAMSSGTDSVRAVVLTDTHLRPGSHRRLPDAVYTALEAADVVLHAGDVLTRDVLDELRGFAPVYAVLGNNDVSLRGELPLTRVEAFAGVTVGMIHDSGMTVGRAARLARRFPTADVVVYGHSHAPHDSVDGGLRIFNPGSCIERRRAPSHTYGERVFAAGQIAEHRIIPID
jgi:putative phosphoesterase